MNRSGAARAPFLDLEVVPCPDALQRESLSLDRWKTPPPKPGNDGKHNARMHAVDVHVVDPLDRVVAPGDHVVIAHRLHAVLRGGSCPATAFKPICG